RRVLRLGRVEADLMPNSRLLLWLWLSWLTPLAAQGRNTRLRPWPRSAGRRCTKAETAIAAGCGDLCASSLLWGNHHQERVGGRGFQYPDLSPRGGIEYRQLGRFRIQSIQVLAVPADLQALAVRQG